jgi:pilus assembly protein CpaB
VAIRNLLIAVGCVALLAGLMLATIWISRAPAKPEAASQAPTPPAFLVAARPLAGGTLLQPMDMIWKPVAASGAPPGAIVRSSATESAFRGAVTRQDFAAGEALTESALVKSGDRTFLAAVLTPGSRAVSIAVDAPQSVAGLVLPGDRVDLVLTQNFGSGSSDPGHKSVGETVLRDIRVIAVDQWLMTIAKPAVKDQRIGASTSPIPGTVTLEVTDSEAERALVAVQLGKVQLTVRALEGPVAAQAESDRTGTPTWAADVSPVLRLLRHDEPASLAAGMPPRAAPPGPRFSVEVMHGSKTEIQ